MATVQQPDTLPDRVGRLVSEPVSDRVGRTARWGGYICPACHVVFRYAPPLNCSRCDGPVVFVEREKVVAHLEDPPA
jgi:transcription initiation factor IIE alpha subunit